MTVTLEIFQSTQCLCLRMSVYSAVCASVFSPSLFFNVGTLMSWRCGKVLPAGGMDTLTQDKSLENLQCEIKSSTERTTGVCDDLGL